MPIYLLKGGEFVEDKKEVRKVKVMIIMTESEKDMLNQLCGTNNESYSAYIRRLIYEKYRMETA
jgi:hypothetical protein